MAIELSPETERQVEELVQSGRFSSADECFRAVVAQFRHIENDQKERMAKMRAHGEEVRRLVDEGAAALENGDFVEYDDESLKAFFEQIKREGRESRKLQAAS